MLNNNNTFIDSAEDLDIAMPVYNLLEYNDNNSMTGCLRNYYRDEVNDDADKNNDDDFRINNNRITTSKFFEYEMKIIGSTRGNDSRLDAEVVVPLKYLGNFGDFLISL